MKRHMMSSPLSALVLLAACSTSEPTPSPPRLTTVTVTCASSSVKQHNSIRCTAAATDEHGEPLAVPDYTWMTSDERVAKVDSQGTVSAAQLGAVVVTARGTAEGVTAQGQASLTVTERVPTVHSAPITADETWRASDNPHVVHGLLEVNGPPGATGRVMAGAFATLTLEAGVEVRFDEDAQLEIKQGALKAQGTQAQPILLVANQAEPTRGFWRGLLFSESAGDSLMEHVTLSHCGRGAPKDQVGGCLSLSHNTTLVARDLTIRGSGSLGVWFIGDSEFAAGSARLSISGSKLNPVRVRGDGVGALPPESTFTGNDRDSIQIGSSVTRSQTWPNLGIPYDLDGPDMGVIGNASTPITLTISAGTVLRFGPYTSFQVSGSTRGLVDLVVNGTEEAPVRFTSQMARPRPGDWGGVMIGDVTSKTRLSHTIIEYAGRGFPSRRSSSNLELTGSSSCTDCPTLDHVILQKSSVDGMALQGGRPSSASTGLTIRDNGKCAISMPADEVGRLPERMTVTMSGNSSDAVCVHGAVQRSQTWPNLGIPYDVVGNLNITDDSTMSTSSTTLTLSAGTVLRFEPMAALVVGSSPAYEGRSASLVVAGTAQAPVRIVPNTSTPSKAFWRGVHIHANATGSRIDHAIISHAGAGESSLRGNLNVYHEHGGFVTHSTFSDGDACGIMVRAPGPGGAGVTTDFTLPVYNNTFRDNANAPQCAR